MTQHQCCAVCNRERDGFDSGKRSSTSSALEPHFCSRYCRLFDEQGLTKINGEEKYGKSQFRGFDWWPKIAVNCDFCGEPFDLSCNGEHNNQVFCGLKCSNAVKTSKRKAMRCYQTLRILRTLGWANRTHEKDGGWLEGRTIAKKLEQFNYKANGGVVGGLIRKWVSRGIVEQQLNSNGGSQYRLAPKYRDKPLGKLVWEYNQRPVQKVFAKV